jgi:UDP-glucose 4-epimerase
VKKALITGVAGMIGSHLLDGLLKKGYRVTGVDNLEVGKLENIKHQLKNDHFRFIRADILDADAIKKAAGNKDVIIHMAASKKIAEDGDAFKTLTVNADGTRNVLEAAKKRRTKVVFASTSDVYGLSGELPFKESGRLLLGSPVAKRWAYAASKMYGEHLALAYYKEFKVPVVIIRYFGGFSPRASFSWSGGHIPVFIRDILENKSVTIHGDGRQTRSMAYVDDLVRGTIMAMENPDAIGEIFNIGNDEEMSVADSARLIHRIANTGKKLKIRFVPAKNIFGAYEEIKRRVPDLGKSKKLLGYYPKVKLSEGIKITIDEYLRRESAKTIL